MRIKTEVSLMMQYVRDVVIREPIELSQVRTTISTSGELPIHIAPEEGRLLQMLIRLGGYRKVVEIGTHAGYSTLWMALALPSDSDLYTIERDKKRLDLAKSSLERTPTQCRTWFIQGEALQVLDQKLTEKGPFDMVFIDADKLNYCKYLDWSEKNLRRGGLIVGDNTFLHGAVWGEPTTTRVSKTALLAMREFNQRLGDQTRFCSVMLPTSEGWTMGVKL
jgi:predicted O-methyltransferase YrrM